MKVNEHGEVIAAVQPQIELWVRCPHCDKAQDIVCGDDGYFVKQFLEGCLAGEYAFCSNCGEEFVLEVES